MTDASPERPKALFRRKALYCLVAILVLGAAIGWFLWRLRTGKPAPAPEEAPSRLPVIALSPFRNASKTVGYVGSAECIECHRDQHQSYLRTTHSRSLGAVDVSQEPPGAEHRHELSGRSYRISRDGAT